MTDDTKAEKAAHAGVMKGHADELKVLQTENADLKKTIGKQKDANGYNDGRLREAEIAGLKAENECLRQSSLAAFQPYPKWVYQRDAKGKVLNQRLVESEEDEQGTLASWK